MGKADFRATHFATEFNCPAALVPQRSGSSSPFGRVAGAAAFALGVTGAFDCFFPGKES